MNKTNNSQHASPRQEREFPPSPRPEKWDPCSRIYHARANHVYTKQASMHNIKEKMAHIWTKEEKIQRKRKEKKKTQVVSSSNGINRRVQGENLRRQLPGLLVPFAERTSTRIRGATDRDVALGNEWTVLKRSSQDAVFVRKHHSRREFGGTMSSLLTNDSAADVR